MDSAGWGCWPSRRLRVPGLRVLWRLPVLLLRVLGLSVLRRLILLGCRHPGAGWLAADRTGHTAKAAVTGPSAPAAASSSLAWCPAAAPGGVAGAASASTPVPGRACRSADRCSPEDRTGGRSPARQLRPTPRWRPARHLPPLRPRRRPDEAPCAPRRSCERRKDRPARAGPPGATARPPARRTGGSSRPDRASRARSACAGRGRRRPGTRRARRGSRRRLQPITERQLVEQRRARRRRRLDGGARRRRAADEGRGGDDRAGTRRSSTATPEGAARLVGSAEGSGIDGEGGVAATARRRARRAGASARSWAIAPFAFSPSAGSAVRASAASTTAWYSRIAALSLLQRRSTSPSRKPPFASSGLSWRYRRKASRALAEVARRAARLSAEVEPRLGVGAVELHRR